MATWISSRGISNGAKVLIHGCDIRYCLVLAPFPANVAKFGRTRKGSRVKARSVLLINCELQPQPHCNSVSTRRDVVLRSTSATMLLALFPFSGTRPSYLGVQKNPPSLALCPPSPNCISTSEELNDPSHFVPPWTYNPEDGRGKKKPVSKEQAMKELLDVINSSKPDNFTPKIVEQRENYLYVEYQSPVLGFVDDVEFWFPPGDKSLVEYRSASRLGKTDFDINRKRIRALRLALEKKGWQSVGY